MADRKKRRKPSPDGEPPRPVSPPAPKLPRSPQEMDDVQLAPGDPYVKAAYQRVGRATSQLDNTLGAALRDADGTDALVIRKMARRSRVMTFQVQGIVWKAGFTKEFNQAPVGAALKLDELPTAELQKQGAIVRPVEPDMETVFRELLPKMLIEEADRMYGLTRVLLGAALYFVPREDGALAGLIVHYGDGPTSRRHFMFLQTSVRRADPRVLDQIAATFRTAVPRAQEAAQEKSAGDFWQELERNLYQVRATYRTSALHDRQEQVKQQITTGLKKTGEGVDKALNQVEKAGEKLEWALNLPARGAISGMNKATDALVWLIRRVDSMMKPKPPKEPPAAD